MINNLSTINNGRIAEATAEAPKLINNWLTQLDATPKTKATYTAGIRPFIKYLTENEINSIDKGTLQTYKQSLINKGLKNTSINLYICCVKMLFEYLEIETDGIIKNVAKSVKGVKDDTMFKKDNLTTQQLNDILNSDLSPRDRAIFALMGVCGLRTKEVATAQIKDYTTAGDKKILHILGKGKTDKNDFVPVPAVIEKLIDNYLKTRASYSDESPLFASESHQNSGNYLNSMSVSRIVKNILRKNGIDSDRVTAHSLRHTAITLSLINGSTTQEAQLLARHANIQTTMKYAHNIDKASNKAADRVAELLDLK